MDILPDENGEYRYRNQQFSVYDLSDGSKTVLAAAECDGLAIAQGHKVNFVLPDGMFYFGVKNEDSSKDIYGIDLNTGEVRYLFTDIERITFRIYGVYNGGYFGRLSTKPDEDAFYWISKEDFCSGNMDAAVCYGFKRTLGVWAASD